MWQHQKSTIPNGEKYTITTNGSVLSYATVLWLWRDSDAFRQFFIELLQQIPYQAYRWETPAVSSLRQDIEFAFVVISDRSLIRPPSPQAFADYLDASPVVAFDNIGRDARLIVPTPHNDLNYCHLGDFMRNAPDQQKHALWQKVGEVMLESLNDKPLWLNTAGTGVPWLHVRLDQWPKYYLHQPFKPV
jgi:hypothetical protein